MTSDPCIVLTTVSDIAEAERIATALVERHLAACVNIVPQIRSIYRWKGNLENGSECQLVVKTTKQRIPAVEEVLKLGHSYELPECLILDVGGGAEYINWIRSAVR